MRRLIEMAAQVLCALAIGASPVAQALPTGAGAEVVKVRCATCHESDLITSQRLSAAGWVREVDKMIRWGALLSDANRAALQSYLAEHFGPRPPAAGAAHEAAAGVFSRACLTCHQRDIIAEQQLTQAGWTREVEKMTQWGASVSAADKTPLVAYLSARFGPRSEAAR